MSHTASWLILILKVDLVIQEWHNQASSGTGGTALLTLVGADGVVGVDCAFSFFVEAAEDGVHVVREETLLVEHDAQSLCSSLDGHWLAVLVSVEFDNRIETLAQGVAVGGETDNGEEKSGIGLRGVSAADLEDLWDVAGIDGVAGGGTSITGEDGEGITGNGEGRTTVVGVSGMMLAAFLGISREI